MTRFGELLRDTRIAAGKNLIEVANHLGMSIVQVSDYERGIRTPMRRSSIIEFCEYVGVDPNPILAAAGKERRVLISVGASTENVQRLLKCAIALCEDARLTDNVTIESMAELEAAAVAVAGGEDCYAKLAGRGSP